MDQEETIITTTRRVAKNAGALLAGNIISKLCTLIFFAIAARYIGPEGFGKYTFALSFTAMFMVLGDLGLNTIAVREVARDRSLMRKYLGNIAILKLILSFIAVGVIFLVITLLNYPSDTTKIVYILGISVFFSTLSTALRWCFQAFQKMEYEAIVNVVQGIILLGLGLIVLYFGKGLIGLVFVHLSASILIFCFSFLITVKKFAKPKFEINFNFWKFLIKTSLPLGVAVVFATLYLNTDTVMLSLMKGDASVGWYNAAYKLVNFIKVIPAMFVLAIFPVMSEFYKTSIENFKKFFIRFTEYMFLIALPLGIGTVILSCKIIPLIWGQGFSSSIIALQILTWPGVMIFINSIAAKSLIIINKQKIALFITLLSLATNITLNLILIPKLSYIGASIAIAIAEFLATILIFYFVYINLRLHPFSIRILKILIASLAMGAFTWVIQDLNIIFVILLSIILYSSTIFIWKIINFKELRQFLRI